MEAVIITGAKPDEIAALVLAIQERQGRLECIGMNAEEMVRLLCEDVKNLSERFAAKDGTSTKCRAS